MCAEPLTVESARPEVPALPGPSPSQTGGKASYQKTNAVFPTRRWNFTCRTTLQVVYSPRINRHHSSIEEFHLSYQQQQTVPAGNAVPLWAPYYGAPIGEAARRFFKK